MIYPKNITDNEGELTNNHFKKYCKINDINSKHSTKGYNPKFVFNSVDEILFKKIKQKYYK